MSPSAVPSARMICQSALTPATSVPLISGPLKVRLEPVDRGQARVGKQILEDCRRVVRMRLERRDPDLHPFVQRQSAQEAVELRLAVCTVEAEDLGLAVCDRLLPHSDEMPFVRQASRG
jgi:hypothetical protein